jgi:hypothetical protein
MNVIFCSPCLGRHTGLSPALLSKLERGDAMYFDASVPHSYRRTGRTACSALIFSVA